jgi:hypothetical protein
MLAAQRDHAVRVVVFALAPWRIEVMPIEARAATSSHRTPKSHFTAKLSSNLDRGRPIHRERNYRGERIQVTGEWFRQRATRRPDDPMAIEQSQPVWRR